MHVSQVWQSRSRNRAAKIKAEGSFSAGPVHRRNEKEKIKKKKEKKVTFSLKKGGKMHGNGKCTSP
jgi:hypothetical protein